MLLKIRGPLYKSYLEKFIPQYDLATQYIANSIKNMNSVLKKDFHMQSGMKYLIESFYRSITDSTPPPISYREIILTSRIMDSIFSQINARKD